MAAKNTTLDGDVPLNSQPESRIAGHVVDEAGQPIAHAYVGAVVLGGRNEYPYEVIADRGGHFDFFALDPGEYNVRAASPDSRFENGRSKGTVVRVGTLDVKLVLVTGAVISGRVLFGGKPMPHFGISLRERDTSFSGGRQATRDADGQFTLRNVEPGTWQLTLVGPGTRMKLLDPITVESGRPVDVGDVALEPGQRVCGHVRDPSGAPLLGARVIIGHAPGRAEAQSQPDRWFQGLYETTTDATGAYVFDGVDGRHEFMGPRRIWATHPNSGVSVISELPDEDATVDIELLGSGRIEGVVEGLRGGVPLVFARRADEPEAARRELVTKSSEVRFLGEFRFDDAPPGDYIISLGVPETVATSPVQVTVVDGQMVTAKLAMVTSRVRLNITVPSGRGRNLVLASADDSTPEPDQTRPRIVMGAARITMIGNPSPPSSEKETATFDYLQPGSYRVSFDGQTWIPIVVTSRREEQSVEITSPE